MAIVQAGTSVPPVKVGTAHKLRKRFYPDPLWDRYVEKISEQDRRHQEQIRQNQKPTNPPPKGAGGKVRPEQPPSTSQPSRRFTSSTGPKFVSYPYTSWYCVIFGMITLGIGLVALSPVALMLSAGMLVIPIAVGSEDNVNHRSGTEDSGPR